MVDTDTDTGTTTTRRTVLKLSGLAGLLATGAIAAGQSSGEDDLFVGGDSDAGFRHGVWSFAPESFPPDDSRYAWVARDGSTDTVRVPSLPATFTAAGAQWSLASDLATAKGNVTSRPAIAIGDGDGASVLTNDSLPVTWTGGGVEHVAAGTLADAQSAHSGARPAVLFGGDFQAEVRV